MTSPIFQAKKDYISYVEKHAAKVKHFCEDSIREMIEEEKDNYPLLERMRQISYSPVLPDKKGNPACPSQKISIFFEGFLWKSYQQSIQRKDKDPNLDFEINETVLFVSQFIETELGDEIIQSLFQEKVVFDLNVF
jgi:hypothetical protein